MSTTTTTITSTTALYGSVYADKILDNFPLSETEVDRLLLLFHEFQETPPEMPLSQLCQRANHDTAVNRDVAIDAWLSQLHDVEQTLLPNIRYSMDKACQSVDPLLPYDIPNDKSEPLCQLFYFLEAIVSLLGRRGTRFWTRFVYDRALDTQSSHDNDGANPNALVEVIYRHLLAALYLTNTSTTTTLEPPKAWVASLLQSAQRSNTTTSNCNTSISRPAFTEWISNVIPESTRGFSTLFHHILFPPQHPYGPSSPPPLVLPTPDQESHFWTFPNNTTTIPLSLACISPVLNGPWYRLYSSSCDGSSFFTFQNALLSYKGPTVLLLRPKNTQTNDGNVFGFYSDCPWNNHTHTWFGGGQGHDSFLFQLTPQLRVYWPTWQQDPAHYMYLNSSTTTGTHGLQGLAIGGIAKDTPRVHLTRNWEHCKATAIDTTYASGPLLGDDSSFFDVDIVEVWAVHATTRDEYQQNVALGQQAMNRTEQARQRAAQVDRTQFLNDFQSGAFLNNLYAHREEARGRHDFVASEEQGMGYFLEGKRPSEEILLHHSPGKPTGASSGKEEEPK